MQSATFGPTPGRRPRWTLTPISSRILHDKVPAEICGALANHEETKVQPQRIAPKGLRGKNDYGVSPIPNCFALGRSPKLPVSCRAPYVFLNVGAEARRASEAHLHGHAGL